MGKQNCRYCGEPVGAGERYESFHEACSDIFFEWQNEQPLSGGVVCPWCMTDIDDDTGLYDDDTHDVECPHCGKVFECEVLTVYYFQTRKREAEFIEILKQRKGRAENGKDD